jgi:hypothetical protein
MSDTQRDRWTVVRVTNSLKRRAEIHLQPSARLVQLCAMRDKLSGRTSLFLFFTGGSTLKKKRKKGKESEICTAPTLGDRRWSRHHVPVCGAVDWPERLAALCKTVASPFH